MKKSDVTKFVQRVGKATSKHSPAILTGLGVAGMFTTVVLAVRATPKALESIEVLEEPTKVEVVKATWKHYVPAAVTGLASTACIIGANTVSSRRYAALTTAYQLSTTALTEYKDKVVQVVGEKKEKEIRQEIVKDKLDQNPVSKTEVFMTGKGNALCFDVFSSRYFKSDIDRIKKAQNDLNARMLSQEYISVNDYYSELGLRHTPNGYQMGWRVDRGLLDFHYSSMISDDGEPCLTVDFNIMPDYGYSSLV